MAEVLVPISITYDVSGITPVGKVIDSLRASEAAINEAIDLLPSFVPTLVVLSRSVGVERISQQSPLRELLVVAIALAQQETIGEFVTPYAEAMLGRDISKGTGEMLGLLVSIVIIYGASAARDIIVKKFEDNRLKEQLNTLVGIAAKETGRTERDIRAILDTRYSEPGLFKKVTSRAREFFAPSHHEGTASVQIGDHIIPSEVVSEIPMTGAVRDKDLARYQPVEDVEVSIHAMDRDKSNTGWAAVIPCISDRRLKLRIAKELDQSSLWGRDRLKGDVVVVEKLTASGFQAQEYQLIRVH